MLYMSGGGVQIFSMGIVFMLLSSPFKNVVGMNRGASEFFYFYFSSLRIASTYPISLGCTNTN